MPFKLFFNHIADSLGKKRAKYYAGPVLSQMAIVASRIKSIATGTNQEITRENVVAVSKQSFYDNRKICEALNFKFENIEKIIRDTSILFLDDHKMVRT